MDCSLLAHVRASATVVLTTSHTTNIRMSIAGLGTSATTVDPTCNGANKARKVHARQERNSEVSAASHRSLLTASHLSRLNCPLKRYDFTYITCLQKLFDAKEQHFVFCAQRTAISGHSI